MKESKLIQLASDFVNNSSENYIAEENSDIELKKNIRIFEEPIFAFGDVEDDEFKRLKEEGVIGEHFKLPKEWLPKSKTVVSFFLKFNEDIRKPNAMNKNRPSNEWLIVRIEGHSLLDKLTIYLKNVLVEEGYGTLVPSLGEDFFSRKKPEEVKIKNNNKFLSFTSNWSERHISYVCGLGTFGLSKGIITKKGVAGRFCSLITEADFKSTEREYRDIYEYCNKCGECITRCPVDAISFKKGKEHLPCCDFIDKVRSLHELRYGCGKCQVKVPCENGIPNK
ncbi:MAG: 4Fe-4S binding protein [Bacillota bacterium]|nr:4Fe-4S binding protein [Bacillota bacterium]